MRLNNFFRYYIFFTIALLGTSVFAENHTSILVEQEIFYLSPTITKHLKAIENECDVEIDYDNYNSNKDLLYLLMNHEYDIAIVPSIYLNKIKRHIPEKQNKDLEKNIELYHDSIKSYYYNSNFPNNILFFSHNIIGALVKDNYKVKINNSYLKNLISNKIPDLQFTVNDDPLANYMLFNHDSSTNPSTDKVIHFIADIRDKHLNKNITVSDYFNDRMLAKNFKLAFTSSSSAYRNMQELDKNNVKTSFFVLDNSYIATNLITQLNRKQSTDCVMSNLSSKSFLDLLNFENANISPYINRATVNKKPKSNIQHQYLDYLNKNPKWEHFSENLELSKIFYEWDKYKIELLKSKQ